MTNIDHLHTFKKYLKEIFKKFPRSEKNISKVIDSLTQDPYQGDAYPGFGELEVRKIRLPLSEYSIGKSKGLRLIYVYVPVKDKVIPLVMYQKNKYATEDEIKRLIIAKLKELDD